MKIRVKKQGRVVVEPADGGGLLVMFPNGDTMWAVNSTVAFNNARRWLRRHLGATEVGVAEIEWRGVNAPANAR